jgi:hypothetical protein
MTYGFVSMLYLQQMSKESKKMSILSKSSSFLRRALVLTAALGCGAVAMNAQTTDEANTTAPVRLNTAIPMYSASSLYSTSTDETAAQPANTNLALNVTPFNFVNAMQYGSGSRSGAPRYRGGNSNADGSNRWIFFGGGGLASPIGNTHHYFTPSWGFQGGFGRQFSKKFAVPIEFDYDHFGMTGQTLNNQLTLYNNDINYFCSLPANAATCATNGVTDFSTLDGNMHVWSFTVDPTETFAQTDSWGAYAVEGVGFYHKVSNFLTPQTETVFDPFFGPESFTANAVIDHYTSNAAGFNAGLGITYKFSKFSNERFYGEVRYVFVANSYRPGVTVNSPVATTYNETNDFPANSNRTGYFPIKFGIRF